MEIHMTLEEIAEALRHLEEQLKAERAAHGLGKRKSPEYRQWTEEISKCCDMRSLVEVMILDRDKRIADFKADER